MRVLQKRTSEWVALMGPSIEHYSPVFAIPGFIQYRRGKVNDRGLTRAPSSLKSYCFATTLRLYYFGDGPGDALVPSEFVSVSAGVSSRSLVGHRSSIAITDPYGTNHQLMRRHAATYSSTRVPACSRLLKINGGITSNKLSDRAARSRISAPRASNLSCLEARPNLA